MSKLKDNLTSILTEKNEKLLPENLRKGVTCLGIEGTLIPDTNDADATESDILEGKTAYVKDAKITGTIPDNSELNYIPSEEEQLIPEGYFSELVIEKTDIERLENYKSVLNVAKQISSNINVKPYIKYINSSVYTDLDMTTNANYKYEIYFDDNKCETGDNVSIFGGYDGRNGILFCLGRCYRVAHTSQSWTYTNSPYKPGQHILIISNDLGYQLDGEQIYPIKITNSTANLYLNKANYNECSGFDGKIFEFIVYNEQDEIIFDAIPDKSGTFKDTVSGKLLTTSGEVEFGYDNWTGYKSPTYTELEYISNPNRGFIATPINNVDYCMTELKIQGISNSNQRIFGFDFTNYHIAYWYNLWYYGSEGDDTREDHSTEDCPIKLTDICTIKYNNEDNVVDINGYTFGHKVDIISGISSKRLLVFGEYDRWDSELYHGKMYYFKITNKHTKEVILDLIPAKDSYENIGMYDKISKKFYIGVGNDLFTAGPEIGPLKEV